MTRGNRREEYHQQFPMGFKRKRNAAQREKQRVSQRRYALRCRAGTVVVRRLLRLANGGGCPDKCEELVGCSRDDFVRHLHATMVHPDVPRISIRFHVPLSKYNLDDKEQAKQAFHYTNMYAVDPVGPCVARRSIPLTIEAARRMAGAAWV